MTEAVEIILNYAFKDLKLHRLEANVQPNNTPSINILKRAGFTKEGFSRKYLKMIFGKPESLSTDYILKKRRKRRSY